MPAPTAPEAPAATTVDAPIPTAAATTLASAYDVYGDEPAEPVAAAASPPASPKPAAPKAEPKPKPAALVRRAETLGLSKSFIDRATTEELAETVVEMMDRAPAPSIVEPVAKAAPVAQPEPEPEFDWGEIEEDGVRRKVKDDDIHEPIVKAFKRQQKEIEGLKKLLAERDAREAHSAERTLESKLDAAFAANERLFGRDSGESLKKSNSVFFHRRKAVFDAMMAIPPAERAKLTIEQAVAQVTEDLFGVAAAATPEQKPAPKDRVENWNKGAVAPPTARKGPPDNKPGRAKAVDAVAELLREQDGNGDGETNLDGFLD